MIRIKRADRLIAGSVLGSLLIVWVVLVGFDTLTQFLRQLGDVGKHGYTLAEAAVYIGMTVPRRLYEYFSFAGLIGGLLGLGGLAASGELTALRAAGMSKLRIAASVVAVVAALTAVVVLMGETVGPLGDQAAQAMQVRLRSNNLGLTRGSGLWARDGHDIINAKAAQAVEKDGHPSVQLADVRVFTLTDDGQLTQFSWARTADHIGGTWTLHDVQNTTLDAKGTHASTAKDQVWHSSLNPRVLEQSIVHPEYLSMVDLQRNIRYLERNGQNPGVYASAFWARALYPLNVLALVLCAMPFAFGGLRSGGLGKRLFIGILLAVAWYFLQRSLTSMGSVYGIPPLLSNLLPALVLLGVAGYYFRRHA
ncbi:LPS export ABC transporter permease LptG [Oleiagrimonas sp. C23AA]|uniref:LPS export ABC transporter permease LptG n=1 Tax=Oleiagrimonas sp. C23AA TaxID=2719047 RepID=UPI00141EDB97|nr:LPS export ABC transporter permease LptG [Oleiagrimonas sp. C23AA]NII12078.1 LPS export ABC transporter permease LptG [Oleiagrimonas sp. C23AA]